MVDAEPGRRPITAALVQLVAVLGALGLVASLVSLPAALAAKAAVDAVDSQLLDVPPLPEDAAPLAQTSYVRAGDGTLLGELHGEIDRVPIPLNEVSLVARHAVLATEDADFYEHAGVDHRAIIRAAITNAREGRIEEGASTITQQYVRNVMLHAERTIERKINEALWAIQLEQRLSKDEILERYLNTVYFGNGVYGIGTAAEFYFSKPASELELHEAALLAGLVRAPQRNDPIDNPEAARTRRDIVLTQMVVAGFIEPAAAAAARARDLGLNIQGEDGPLDPFVVDWVKRVAFDPTVDLQPELQEALGDDPAARRKAVFEGGITIVTTIDTRLQALAHQTIDDWLDDPLDDPMTAIVSLQPNNAAVRALAVGPEIFGQCPPEQNEACAVTKLNPAVPGGGGSGRQPGSAFKPIVAATALDAGIPASWEARTPSGRRIEGCGSDDEPYAPENYSQRDRGVVDMYEGLRKSVNVYAVKLAREVGILRVADMARRLGIQHSPNLNERHFGANSCSIALGTAQVFPLELAAAYATFANHGVACDPYVVERVLDRDGSVLYQHEPRCRRVLSEDDAIRLVDILRGPPGPGGTAPVVGRTLDRPVAGKTGTTTNWVDAWFMGFVPQVVTATWVGYERPVCAPGSDTSCGSMFGVSAGGTVWRRVTGGTIPAHMWADYMAAVVEPMEPLDFPEPGPIPMVRVPDVTGLSVSAAQAALEEAGLRSRVVPEDATGTVRRQRPREGARVEEGTLVRIDTRIIRRPKRTPPPQQQTEPAADEPEDSAPPEPETPPGQGEGGPPGQEGGGPPGQGDGGPPGRDDGDGG